MKNINIAFEDVEYDQILKVKGELTWREFFKFIVRESERKGHKAVPDKKTRDKVLRKLAEERGWQ